MSCNNLSWVLCDDGTCRQCGSSQGYPTKEECMANKSRTWPVNCKELCNPGCYGFSFPNFIKGRSIAEVRENYTPCSFPSYMDLQNSWTSQKPYRT